MDDILSGLDSVKDTTDDLDGKLQDALDQIDELKDNLTKVRGKGAEHQTVNIPISDRLLSVIDPHNVFPRTGSGRDDSSRGDTGRYNRCDRAVKA